MFTETQWIDSPATLTQKCTNEQENRSEEDIRTEAWRERQKRKRNHRKEHKDMLSSSNKQVIRISKSNREKDTGREEILSMYGPKYFQNLTKDIKPYG